MFAEDCQGERIAEIYNRSYEGMEGGRRNLKKSYNSSLVGVQHRVVTIVVPLFFGKNKGESLLGELNTLSHTLHVHGMQHTKASLRKNRDFSRAMLNIFYKKSSRQTATYIQIILQVLQESHLLADNRAKMHSYPIRCLCILKLS